MKLPAGDRFRPNEEEITSKILDGEAIIINLETGIYYSMEGSGGLAWGMICTGASIEEIASVLEQHYGIAPEAARADVERLAKDLLRENLIQPRGSIEPGTWNGDVVAPPGPYESPKLNVFRDMVDLLALDPPVPELERLFEDKS